MKQSMLWKWLGTGNSILTNLNTISAGLDYWPKCAVNDTWYNKAKYLKSWLDTKLLTLSPLEYIINNGSELLSHVTQTMPKEKLGTGKVN